MQIALPSTTRALYNLSNPWPQEFVDDLHEGGRRFVPILDPGIPLLPGYKPYEDGIKRNIFLRDVTGSPYIGEVGGLAASCVLR